MKGQSKKFISERMTRWLPLLTAVAIAPVSMAATIAGKPNIIIVMADDMGFSDLGCYGSEIRTPAIDRLAAEGISFSNFYNFAICGPSRAALMTGCYPWKVGQHPGANIFNNLKKNCATLPELLKAGGYLTGAVGRLDLVTGENWHNSREIAVALDRFLGSASGGPGNYFKEAKGTPWFKDGERWERPHGEYSTDLISGFAAGFIKGTAGRKKPFFLYVSHYAPHWPLQAKEADITPYRKLYGEQDRETLMQARLDRLITAGLIPEGTKLPESMLNPKKDVADRFLATERMAIHAAMIESIDRNLAEMLAALEEAGKLDNTLILVFSDNGASAQMSYNSPVPEGARPGDGDTFLNHGASLAALSNTPFRDYKASNHEGGIASPLIAWWPKGLGGKGRIEHTPCHIADIMPTCLELAGVSYPERFRDRSLIPMDGRSLVPVLEGEGQGTRVIVWPGAVREGDWKLVMINAGKPELYQLSKDRNETKNLADDFPERVGHLRKLHTSGYSR